MVKNSINVFIVGGNYSEFKVIDFTDSQHTSEIFFSGGRHYDFMNLSSFILGVK